MVSAYLYLRYLHFRSIVYSNHPACISHWSVGHLYSFKVYSNLHPCTYVHRWAVKEEEWRAPEEKE